MTDVAASPGLLARLFKRLVGGSLRLDVWEAKRALAEDPDIVVVDVRQSGEFRSGHLPGSKHIPVGLMPTRAQRLDKDATYLVVCLSGARASRAASAMRKAGCKNVKVLHGGVTAWRRAGFALDK